MSKTKLTLSIDQHVLQFARTWAQMHGTSISKELENLFRLKEQELKESDSSVEKMRGVAASALSTFSDKEIKQQWVSEK